MLESFFLGKASDLIKTFLGEYNVLRKERREEINAIESIFGTTKNLAQHYVIPSGQNVNPADLEEDDTGLIAKTDIMTMFDQFLLTGPRFTHAFILSDAGMGKSPLLVMLKLFHLNKFIKPKYNARCNYSA